MNKAQMDPKSMQRQRQCSKNIAEGTTVSFINSMQTELIPIKTIHFLPLTHNPVCGCLEKPGIHLQSPLRDRNTVDLRRTTHCSLVPHWSSKPRVQYLAVTALSMCPPLTPPLPVLLPPLLPLLAVVCLRTMKHTAVMYAVYKYTSVSL